MTLTVDARAAGLPQEDALTVNGEVIVPSRRGRHNWVRVISPLAIVALWEIVVEAGLLSAREFPAPTTVAHTLGSLINSGELLPAIAISVERVAVGLAIGIFLGVALALIAGLSKAGERIVDAPVQMMRTLPILAMVPLFIVWFGIGNEQKWAMIAFATMFPIYLNLYSGIRNVDSRLVEVATVFGLSRRRLITDVILPGALPSALVGLRISLGVGWLALVICEQINATSGIGYLMTNAEEVLRNDIIMVGLVVYGILGLLSDLLVRLLERRTLSWRSGFEGVS